MKRAYLLFLIFVPLLLFSQTPFNWYLDEIHPGLDIHLSPDPDFLTEGSRSCKMQLDSRYVPYLISEEFNVNPGMTYNFSIDVFDNDTLGQLKIYADFYDDLGNNVFDHDPVSTTDSSVWQTIAWSGTVPVTAARGYVMIKFYSQPNQEHFIDTAYAWIDNASFDLQGGNNILANGGFENWTSGENELASIRSVKIYPNPARTYIRIDTPRSIENASIIDLMGKTVLEIRSPEEMAGRIDISDLNPGIYMIVFRNARGVVENKKLIKH